MHELFVLLQTLSLLAVTYDDPYYKGIQRGGALPPGLGGWNILKSAVTTIHDCVDRIFDNRRPGEFAKLFIRFIVMFKIRLTDWRVSIVSLPHNQVSTDSHYIVFPQPLWFLDMEIGEYRDVLNEFMRDPVCRNWKHNLGDKKSVILAVMMRIVTDKLSIHYEEIHEIVKLASGMRNFQNDVPILQELGYDINDHEDN